MMRMAIEGLGVAGSFGNSLDALALAAHSLLAGQPFAVNRQADTESLKAYMPARALRRVDHFTRMTLLAAFSALADAGLTSADLADTGIVLATGYGPARLTFDFLDSLIDYGPEMASPLAFSHSVHNIPAATVALTLKVTGPCTTVSQFETSVGAALTSASAWLTEGRVSRVLVGAADEFTDYLEVAAAAVANELPSPGSGGRRGLMLGDGAVFLLLHGDAKRARHGFISDIVFSGVAQADPIRETLFFSGAAPFDRSAFYNYEIYDFSSVYGHIPIAMAFDIAIAAQALAGGLHPVVQPHAQVRCISRDSFGNTVAVTINGVQLDA